MQSSMKYFANRQEVLTPTVNAKVLNKEMALWVELGKRLVKDFKVQLNKISAQSLKNYLTSNHCASSKG